MDKVFLDGKKKADTVEILSKEIAENPNSIAIGNMDDIREAVTDLIDLINAAYKRGYTAGKKDALKGGIK